jgi:large subunit ribosomal protein L11
MKNKIAEVKFIVPAGRAAPNQTLSQLFAKYSINANNFCEEFNNKTEPLDDFEDDVILLNVFLQVYEDKTFAFDILKPSTSMLILFAVESAKGNSSKISGYVELADLIAIANFRFPLLSLQSACNSVLGTARSLGVFLKN